MRFDNYDKSKMRRHIEEVQAHNEDRWRTQDAEEAGSDEAQTETPPEQIETPDK